MPSKYEQIEGYFDFPHLYERMVQEAPKRTSFIEIGSWKGRSACYLAELIQESGKMIDLYCIDTWTGNVFGDGGLGSDFQVFKNNLTNQGLIVNTDTKDASNVYKADITAIIQDSLSAADIFLDESLFFVFLDGAHGYENVVKEIQLYLPKIVKGGYLGGHDFPDDNVHRAVADTLGLDKVEHISNIREPDVKASFLYKVNNES